MNLSTLNRSSIESAQDWLCSLDTDHEWAAQTLTKISAGEFPFNHQTHAVEFLKLAQSLVNKKSN